MYFFLTLFHLKQRIHVLYGEMVYKQSNYIYYYPEFTKKVINYQHFDFETCLKSQLKSIAKLPLDRPHFYSNFEILKRSLKTFSYLSFSSFGFYPEFLSTISRGRTTLDRWWHESRRWHAEVRGWDGRHHSWGALESSKCQIQFISSFLNFLLFTKIKPRRYSSSFLYENVH